MSGHHHERRVCSCGTVILQCRCPAPKTDVVVPGGCGMCGARLSPRPPATPASPPARPERITLRERLQTIAAEPQRWVLARESSWRTLDAVWDELTELGRQSELGKVVQKLRRELAQDDADLAEAAEHGASR